MGRKEGYTRITSTFAHNTPILTEVDNFTQAFVTSELFNDVEM